MKLTDEQIATELTALRESPSEDFAARLDRRVAAGFPAANKVKAGRELTWGRLLPALGAVAALAVTVVVISSSGGGREDNATHFASHGGPAPAAGTDAFGQGKEAPQGTRDIAGSLPSTPQASSSRPRIGREQVQERTAQIGLATDPDEIQSAAGGVVDVTDRYDGIVDSSNVHTGGARGRASYELRIPTQHLQDALSDFSDLGRVTLLNQGSSNVTGAYVDAGKAYADARANVDDLREQLRNTSSPSEAAAIRAQLDAARQQLAAARAALRGIKGRVAYTPVSVEITAQDDGSWSIGDAADDAVGVIEAIAGALLITLAVLVPLAALVSLGWLGAREFNRRRREATLGR
jgi:uncharacterized protein DUF4349